MLPKFLCFIFITSSITWAERRSELGHEAPKLPRNARPPLENVAASDNVRLSEHEILDKILIGYDARARPEGTDTRFRDGGPVVVTVNIYVRNLNRIDEVNMEYNTQFTFRQEWKDPRLAYASRITDLESRAPPFLVLPTDNDVIWKPDTFFQNELDARTHNLDKPNRLIRVYPDGKILYSIRLSLRLSCPMSLEYFPFDRQTCLLDLASYAYTTEDIKYEWKRESPIQLKAGVEASLPNLNLQSVNASYCTSKTATGEYSCLRALLNLKREAKYFIMQFYIPSVMLVIVSWFAFWLDSRKTTARVIIGVITLLVLANQSTNFNSTMPRVSYVKSIDIWNGCCLAFIFLALLEVVLVSYAATKEKRLEDALTAATGGDKVGQHDVRTAYPALPSLTPAPNPAASASAPDAQDHRPFQISPLDTNTWPYNPSFAINGFGPPTTKTGFFQIHFQQHQRAKRIDMVSRMLFPLAFIVFIGVYWFLYV